MIATAQTIEPALTPEVDTQGAMALVEKTQSMVITTNEEYQAADTLVASLRKERKGIAGIIETFFDKHKKKARAAWQGLVDDEKAYIAQHDAPLAAAEQKVIGLMRKFEADAKAERERLQREAEEKARLERLAAQKKAEDERLAAAAKLEAEGKGAEAEAVLTAPAPLAPPRFTREVVFTDIPKAKSAGTRENWVWEAKDKVELIKAAAANPEAYAQHLEFNDVTLKALAKSLKGQARVPGVTFVDRPINVVR